MYQDNGVNEFAAVCNVTFKGMELAGSFTKSSAKAFLRVAKFLFTVGRWAYNQNKDKKYRKAGKKSQKIMKDKFQGDVLYGKVESVQSVAQRLEVDNKSLTEDQLKRLPDNKWIAERFEELAKAHGFEYCIMPSKKGEDLFIQYPKQQEAVYQEIVTELQEEVKTKCEQLFKQFDKENEKRCEEAVKACKDEISSKENQIKEAKVDLQAHRKIKDRVGETKCGELLARLQEELDGLKEKLVELKEKWNIAKKQTSQDLIEQLHPDTQEAVEGQVMKKVTPIQYLEQSGLLAASDKEFDEEMKKHFPEEYAEVEKELKQKVNSIKESYISDSSCQKKKQEFVRQINEATRKEAKKNGQVVEMEIPIMEYVKNEEKSISFPHPEYPEFMVTVSADGICGWIDDSDVKRSEGKTEGSMRFSVYKDAEVEIRVPVMDAVSGKAVSDEKGNLQFINKKISYEKFDKHVKEVGATAAAAMMKKQREMQRAARRTHVPQMNVQKGTVNVKK